MRTLLLTSVAVLGLAAGGASAQVSNAQNPPSPTASSQLPQPTNSLPAGAASATTSSPGAAVGGPAVVAPRTPPVVAVAPPVVAAPPPAASAVAQPVAPAATASAPAAATSAAPPMRRRHAAMRRRVPAEAAADESAAPPTEAYRGGVGSPLSTHATDLTAAPGERIGARLPNPDAAGNDPHDLLVAAQRNLNRGQTGAAQQALEMAETRVLSRTTDPSMANQPDTASMVQNIAAARRALGARNVNGAKQAIAAALQDQVPPPGPAVTTIPGTPAPMGAPAGQSF